MSSIVSPASSSTRRPASSIAGVFQKCSRCETNACSCASLPDCGNTHLSRATPSASAFAAEQRIRAADMSTSLLEFIIFGYGKPTMRFFSVTVRISSAVCPFWSHAYWLVVATCANRDHSSLMCRW